MKVENEDRREAVAMGRGRRERKKARAEARDAESRPDSENIDLDARLAAHMLDDAAAEATAVWQPSRRGQSGRDA